MLLASVNSTRGCRDLLITSSTSMSCHVGIRCQDFLSEDSLLLLDDSLYHGLMWSSLHCLFSVSAQGALAPFVLLKTSSYTSDCRRRCSPTSCTAQSILVFFIAFSTKKTWSSQGIRWLFVYCEKFYSLLYPPPPPPTSSLTAENFADFFTKKTPSISKQFLAPQTPAHTPLASVNKLLVRNAGQH